MRARHRGAAVAIALALAASACQGASTGASADGWTPPRTPDGQPDLQGVWTNYTATPFEVPDERDDLALYSGDTDGTGRGTGPAAFLTDTTGRTLAKGRSLVVDPPNGRVPILPWAEEQRTFKLLHIQDHWEHHTPWERCITRGVPGGIFPTGYGSGYQILQGPGYVAIVYEMIHEARIIPTDSRPHVGSGIRLWNGDSVGRWDGDTLVVDIANYNDKGSIATNAATQRVRSIPQSQDLHVVERFTRVDENTIDYEATIEDPKVFTAPWRVAIPLHREPDYRIFEYACHEGNLAIPNTLSAGRALRVRPR
ncbi:MAG: hypothetical protein A3I61_15010 [Acidobacteria bacterium RIFCSPLOWO2_02_FULL_68_18]|nr:MAG: hypothetical protein A3I61_15010 [Acidobacteria bacterium RIFCSPLOWO2_02_FULL_68_18]OFW50362.1 MAG: hypothetical protein A3G77_07815 [Acidobacteria bacterium RIFCSPLOWO2_12_FULL_68_19]